MAPMFRFQPPKAFKEQNQSKPLGFNPQPGPAPMARRGLFRAPLVPSREPEPMPRMPRGTGQQQQQPTVPKEPLPVPVPREAVHEPREAAQEPHATPKSILKKIFQKKLPLPSLQTSPSEDNSYSLSQYIDQQVEEALDTDKEDDTIDGDLSLARMTPGRTNALPSARLKPVSSLPPQFRSLFKAFPYFNLVQSAVMDVAFGSRRNLVVSAPTGAGKTVLFELALIKELQTEDNNAAKKSLFVYLSPMRSLCGERFRDWKQKLGPLGVRTLEMTGDSNGAANEVGDLRDVDLVLTTPEKWDSVTRRWRSHNDVLKRISLVMLDEVHLLNDKHRGHTLEAVVSRMKTLRGEGLRFVAVSATIPNAQDVADWLGGGAECRVFGEEVRPVQLRRLVLGYRATQGDFKFEMNLSYKISELIANYSEGKPTLIFANSRRSTQFTANAVAKDMRLDLDFRQKQRLSAALANIADNKLIEVLNRGVGFHHAGLETGDRLMVEELFLEGALPVLVSTSTLSMGVNLPAHLVIIKSTNHMDAGGYVEYEEAQILQMMGRAGRPQFDTTATAIIMTKDHLKQRYESMTSGTQMVESSLHLHLHEHLNAEIVLSTITDIAKAMEWIKSTYFFIRVCKNPRHYKLPLGLDREALTQRVQDMVMVALNQLAKTDLIDLGDYDVKTKEAGKLMAKYYLAFETMVTFSKIDSEEKIPGMLLALAKCKELEDVQLRRCEKSVLNALNKDKHKQTIRYPVDGKVKDNSAKITILLQSILGCITVSDATLQRESLNIHRTAQRLARCLVEFLWDRKRESFKTFMNAVLVSKSLHAGIWHNSDFVSKQFERVGVAYSTSLVHAGFKSFDQIARANEREIEMALNKQPPFGNHVKRCAEHMPKYDVSIEQVEETLGWNKAKMRLIVHLVNRDKILDRSSAKDFHSCILVVGNQLNETLLLARVKDALLKDRDFETFVTVETKNTRQARSVLLTVALLSERVAGVDFNTTFQPVFGMQKRASEYFVMDDEEEEEEAWMVEGEEKREELLTETVMEELETDWSPEATKKNLPNGAFKSLLPTKPLTPANKLRQMTKTGGSRLMPMPRPSTITNQGDTKTKASPSTPSRAGQPSAPNTPSTQSKVTSFFQIKKPSPPRQWNKPLPKGSLPQKPLIATHATSPAILPRASQTPAKPIPVPPTPYRPINQMPKTPKIQLNQVVPAPPPTPKRSLNPLPPLAPKRPVEQPKFSSYGAGNTSIFDMEETICLDEVLPHMEACEGNTRRKPLAPPLTPLQKMARIPAPSFADNSFQRPAPVPTPSYSFDRPAAPPPMMYSSQYQAAPPSSQGAYTMSSSFDTPPPSQPSTQLAPKSRVLQSFLQSNNKTEGFGSVTPFYQSASQSSAAATPKRPRMLQNFMESVSATVAKKPKVQSVQGMNNFINKHYPGQQPEEEERENVQPEDSMFEPQVNITYYEPKPKVVTPPQKQQFEPMSYEHQLPSPYELQQKQKLLYQKQQQSCQQSPQELYQQPQKLDHPPYQQPQQLDPREQPMPYQQSGSTPSRQPPFYYRQEQQPDNHGDGPPPAPAPVPSRRPMQSAALRDFFRSNRESRDGRQSFFGRPENGMAPPMPGGPSILSAFLGR